MMNMWHRIRPIIGFLLIIALLKAGFIPLASVGAQSGPILAVDPEVSRVPLGCQVKLTLTVEDGLNVNAFDVKVQYDSDSLVLSSWEHGDFLSNLTVVKEDNQPGFLWLAATQLATSAVSGDGSLLIVTFEAKALGTSQVEITDAVFADSEGNKTYPGLESGEVIVVNDPTYTPTPSMTNPPTFTATLTMTQEDTPKDTVVPSATTKPSSTPTFTKTTTPDQNATRTPTATRTARTYHTEVITATRTVSATPRKSVTGTDEIKEPTPTPNEGYPVSVTYTLTPTDNMSPTQTATERGKEAEALDEDNGGSTANQVLVNALLWIILIGGLTAIVLMAVFLIRRKKNENEDLLL